MRLVYFARVREAIGIEAEQYDFPDHVMTIREVLDWLIAESAAYQAAFADPAKLRFAIDQHMVGIDTPIAGADELAIFPPVTGG